MAGMPTAADKQTPTFYPTQAPRLTLTPESYFALRMARWVLEATFKVPFNDYLWVVLARKIDEVDPTENGKFVVWVYNGCVASETDISAAGCSQGTYFTERSAEAARMEFLHRSMIRAR